MIKTHNITEDNKEKRLEWGNSLINWTLEDFEHVYFSDESNMCAEKNGIKWVRKLKEAPYTDAMLDKKKKFLRLTKHNDLGDDRT